MSNLTNDLSRLHEDDLDTVFILDVYEEIKRIYREML